MITLFKKKKAIPTYLPCVKKATALLLLHHKLTLINHISVKLSPVSLPYPDLLNQKSLTKKLSEPKWEPLTTHGENLEQSWTLPGGTNLPKSLQKYPSQSLDWGASAWPSAGVHAGKPPVCLNSNNPPQWCERLAEGITHTRLQVLLLMVEQPVIRFRGQLLSHTGQVGLITLVLVYFCSILKMVCWLETCKYNKYADLQRSLRDFFIWVWH